MFNVDIDLEREAFTRLNSEDRTLALFNMLRSVRNDIALFKRDFITFETNFLNFKPIEQSTSTKIEAMLAKRFDIGRYFVDKILPNVITVIVLGVLYLVFSK